MSNSLDPEQDQLSVDQKVGPDLSPNCLQSYQQMTKVYAVKSMKELKIYPDKFTNKFYGQHEKFPSKHKLIFYYLNPIYIGF